MTYSSYEADVELSITEAGNLKISLDVDGEAARSIVNKAAEWGTDAIFAELLELELGNGWAILTEEDHAQLGNLTTAPAISDTLHHDDMGKIESIETLWWFPEYMVESEIDLMLSQGYVIFTKAH